MVGHESRFDIGVEPAIHTANALHEPNRVPVQIVVDEPGGILQVQTFGKHVRRNENARFGQFVCRELSARRAVIIGSEPTDDLAAVALRFAVDLLDAVDSARGNMLLQVAGGVAELAEDQHFVFLQDRIGLEQLDQSVQLVIVLRFELPQLVEKLADLIEIVKCVGQHFVDLVQVRIEFFNRFEHLIGDEILVGLFLRLIRRRE